MKDTKKWFRWMSLLLMVAVCLTTPASALAASPEPDAANLSVGVRLPYLSNDVCFGVRSTGNKVGVQLYGPTGNHLNYSGLLQKTRSHWLRNSINWRTIEPEDVGPDKYRWGSADAVARAAVDNCANLLITIDNTPDWASEGHNRFERQYLPDFIDLVTALVERYDGDGIRDTPTGAVINYWEIFNEPDYGKFDDGWGPAGARYAEVLKAIYGPVKAANPNAKIVFGGIAANFYIDQGGNFTRDFLDNVLDAGGTERYFDYMNVHHYPFPADRNNWTESNSSGLVEKLEIVRAKLDAHGQQNVPIMVTEVGWHTSGTNDFFPSNADWQGRHVVQLITQALAFGAPVAIWWAFAGSGGGFPYDTGLIESVSGVLLPKDSYAVYSEVVKRLGSSKFERVVSRAEKGSDLEIYQFSDPAGRTFYVAWLNPIAPFDKVASLTFDDSVTQQWQAPHGRVTIFAKDGKRVRTVNDGDDGNGDGNVTVAVGRSPIFIVVE